MRTRTTIFLLLLLLAASLVAAEPPKRILFIGNSYTAGIQSTLKSFVKASPHQGTHLEFITPGGKNLLFHADQKKTIERIRDGKWDIVVLQDQSQTPAVMPARFLEGARKLHEIIAKSGARTAYYQTWGRRDGDKRNMKLYIAVNATAWIPINIYLITLLNYIFRPGEYLVSEGADLLLLWFGFHLSLLALLYCAVTTFKYFFNRQRPLGAALSRLSYGVYIIHIAVMGPIALVLLNLDIPGLLKYPILTVTTYVGCNLLVYVYTKINENWTLKAPAS